MPTVDHLKGFWSVTGHPAVLEVAASVGPDFISIDAQHGVALGSLDTSHFTTITYYDVMSLVRLPSHDPAGIGRALDLGADGVIVPMVETGAQAEAIVSASRHAPAGTRSYGPQSPRLSDGGPPVCVALIETAVGVDDVEEIAEVDGIDWLYVGPADLGLSLAGRSAADVLSVFEGRHPDHKVMNEAWRRVVEAADAHGKRVGLHCSSAEAAEAAFEFGFSVAAVSTDLIEIRRGLQEALKPSL